MLSNDESKKFNRCLYFDQTSTATASLFHNGISAHQSWKHINISPFTLEMATHNMQLFGNCGVGEICHGYHHAWLTHQQL
jgi:hypothetical protein